MDFLDRPMAFEKDEIKLRRRFQYSQAYFYKAHALSSLNISDVLWVENSIKNIIADSEKKEESENDSVYEGKQYCLNVGFRRKNQHGAGFKPLHSRSGGDSV